MLSTDTALNKVMTKDKIAKQVDTQILSTTLGETITLASTDKTTVLYFFAPWCQICHISISNLQTLYEHNQQIDVIAIALDFTSEKDVIDFTNKHQLTFPIALGNETIKQAFDISGYPSYYVINKDNVIVSKSMGYSSTVGLYLRTL